MSIENIMWVLFRTEYYEKVSYLSAVCLFDKISA